MIDASIYNNLQPPKVNDPLETMARVMQIRGAQQQLQLAPLQQQALEMENEQRSLDLQDQQTMRQMLPQLLQDTGGDWEKAVQGLAPHVSPNTAFGLQQLFLGNAEKRASTLKALADAKQANANVQQKENDYLGSLALGVRRAGYSPTVFDAALEHAAAINPDYQQHIGQIRQAVQQDPNTLRQIIDGLISGSESATKESREQAAQDRADEEFQLKKPGLQADAQNAELQQLVREMENGGASDQGGYVRLLRKYPRAAGVAPAAYGPDTLATLKRSMVPVKDQPQFDIDSMKAKMGLMGNSEYDQFLMQYARNLGKTPAQLNPQEGLESFAKFAELKQDPTMRALAIAQKNLATTLARAQLDQMPTAEDAANIADDIQNHRLAPDQISILRGRGNGQLGLMIERAMKKQNPQFNWEQAASEYQLARSPGFQNTVRYMDSVQESIPLVIQRAQALANGNVRSINALLNAGRNQFNNIDVKKFQTDALLVADELGKILQGGGSGAGTSDAKLKQASEILSTSDSPEAIAAALGDVNTLIGFRRQALTKGTYLENTKPGVGISNYKGTATDPKTGHKIGTNDLGSDGKPVKGAAWYDATTGQRIQ
jgi:ribosomal protein L17